MPRVTREENEKRMSAVLAFFRKHPGATGAAAQEALCQGRLTGKKEMPMGKRLLFQLQREAQSAAPKPDGSPGTRRAGVAGSSSASAGNWGSETVTTPMLTGEQYAQLKQLADEVRALLAAHPGDILEVRITRDGARVIRATEAEL